MFSVFENVDLSIEFTLLSLIWPNLKNHQFACFCHILMAFTRSELRFGQFSKQCILDVVQGKLQRSVRKFAVLKIYTVEPDPNVLKHHDFQIIFL